jgi:uncharacterized protein YjbJ (UPF0337 family)
MQVPSSATPRLGSQASGNAMAAWGNPPRATRNPGCGSGSTEGRTVPKLKKWAQETNPLHSGKVSMTEKKNTGPEEGVKGVVEDVKGKAKEAVGTVTGRDDLVREGKAQQDKADAQQDVAKKEAQADSARAGAKAAEKRQEAEQRP